MIEPRRIEVTQVEGGYIVKVHEQDRSVGEALEHDLNHMSTISFPDVPHAETIQKILRGASEVARACKPYMGVNRERVIVVPDGHALLDLLQAIIAVWEPQKEPCQDTSPGTPAE